MPPSVKSIYAGGYSETARRQLETAVIPDKVKCVSCKKVRMQSMFSKRQLGYMKNAVAQGSRSAAVSRCRLCVGGQTAELKCCICDRIKGLNEFARSQRQNHESARCLNCVQDIAESDLVDGHKLLPGSELTTQDSSLTGSHADDESLTETTQRLNLNSPYANSSSSRLSAFGDEDLQSLGGGVWVEPGPRNDENSISKGKDQGHLSTGFDSNGVDRRFVAGSHLESRSNGKGYASGAVDRSQSNMPPLFTQKKVSKFAKVPSRKVEKADQPSMRIPESAGEPIPSDDEYEDHTIEEFL